MTDPKYIADRDELWKRAAVRFSEFTFNSKIQDKEIFSTGYDAGYSRANSELEQALNDCQSAGADIASLKIERDELKAALEDIKDAVWNRECDQSCKCCQNNNSVFNQVLNILAKTLIGETGDK
jgi:hypothetical protein